MIKMPVTADISITRLITHEEAEPRVSAKKADQSECEPSKARRQQ